MSQQAAGAEWIERLSNGRLGTGRGDDVAPAAGADQCHVENVDCQRMHAAHQVQIKHEMTGSAGESSDDLSLKTGTLLGWRWPENAITA